MHPFLLTFTALSYLSMQITRPRAQRYFFFFRYMYTKQSTQKSFVYNLSPFIRSIYDSMHRPLSEPKHHQGWKYLSMYMYTCKHTRSFMIIFMGIRILFNKLMFSIIESLWTFWQPSNFPQFCMCTLNSLIRILV